MKELETLAPAQEGLDTGPAPSLSTTETMASEPSLLYRCICRRCTAAFNCDYESYLCDACLVAPYDRPVGVFEPTVEEDRRGTHAED